MSIGYTGLRFYLLGDVACADWLYWGEIMCVG